MHTAHTNLYPSYCYNNQYDNNSLYPPYLSTTTNSTCLVLLRKRSFGRPYWTSESGLLCVHECWHWGSSYVLGTFSSSDRPSNLLQSPYALQITREPTWADPLALLIHSSIEWMILQGIPEWLQVQSTEQASTVLKKAADKFHINVNRFWGVLFFPATIHNVACMQSCYPCAQDVQNCQLWVSSSREEGDYQLLGTFRVPAQVGHCLSPTPPHPIQVLSALLQSKPTTTDSNGTLRLWTPSRSKFCSPSRGSQCPS